MYEEGDYVPVAKLINGERYSIISDYIGRPVQVYNDAGEIVWETEYDIYGRSKRLKGDRAFQPFRQIGQYEDVELEGLYYNRFRVYDSNTGLYISQDPIRLKGGMALYGYVHDTNSWVDVFGLSVAYEVDTYDNLSARDVKGDGLENHHVPQKALARTQVPGYTQMLPAGDAPAIRLPSVEHRLITTLQIQNKATRSQLTATQLVQEDIDMLRRHTNAPESAIQQLINMNQQKYGIICH
ncbi:MAG TPA: RHS repeat-associated core domain-containing protein [Bacillales bacterium]|nr:RHS repeat-associated core domain-containing protein [Bacillales bacterium]